MVCQLLEAVEDRDLDRFKFKIWCGINNKYYEEDAIKVLKDWEFYCNDVTGYRILSQAIKLAISCMEERNLPFICHNSTGETIPCSIK